MKEIFTKQFIFDFGGKYSKIGNITEKNTTGFNSFK